MGDREASDSIRNGYGSNVREADNALTDADFAHKYSIARKEASETHCWLELCGRAGMLTGDAFTWLLKESYEVASILTTIVMRTQQHMEAEASQMPAKRS
jgi:four helix bundle protein